MHHTRVWLAALFVAVTACSSRAPRAGTVSPPVEVPPTPGLAYTAKEPASYSYDFSDTTVSQIQAGPAGTIHVNIGVRGTADLAFEPGTAEQKVTITFSAFTGNFVNSSGGAPVTATKSDITGPAVVSVRPRGTLTVVARPQVTAAFRTVSGSEGIYRRFFLQLPRGAVQVGATWTDTTTTEETNEGVTTKVQNVIQSTWTRDTTVAGHTLNVISFTADRTLEVSGTSQGGVNIVQKLRGNATGVALWDPERRTLVSRHEVANLNGTFDLPTMNMTNMPINASGRTSTRLRGG
jgi:hypothetical protein